MEQEKLNELVEQLAKAPDSQLDATMCEKLKLLVGKPIDEVKLGLMEVLDLSARYALASGFMMTALNITFQAIGGDLKDFKNDEICTWRNPK